jgi:hypothetical protein
LANTPENVQATLQWNIPSDRFVTRLSFSIPNSIWIVPLVAV